MYKRTTLVFWGICVLALIVSACQGASKATGQIVETGNGSYTSISVPELDGMLENKDFTLINVHIPWQGDIPQTDLKLAYDQIEQSQTQLPADKDAKIVVYCLTSGMAKVAVDSLLSMGYTNLWMLEGGTTAWEEEGFSLEK